MPPYSVTQSQQRTSILNYVVGITYAAQNS